MLGNTDLFMSFTVEAGASWFPAVIRPITYWAATPHEVLMWAYTSRQAGCAGLLLCRKPLLVLHLAFVHFTALLLWNILKIRYRWCCYRAHLFSRNSHRKYSWGWSLIIVCIKFTGDEISSSGWKYCSVYSSVYEKHMPLGCFTKQ